MGRRYRVGVIEGDGVGPEVVREALAVLRVAMPDAEFVEIGAGLNYFRRTGKLIEEGALDLIRSLDAVIKGPLTTPPGPGTYRSVNVLIRQALGLYANVRPFRSYRGVSLKEFDFVIVRENTEGLYSGVEGRFRDLAFSVKVATKAGCERVVRYAFNYAVSRGFRRVTAVHKANILKESDGLFREVFHEVAREYPNVEVNEVFVDAAAYNMVRNPQVFQVVVTPNLYGDILSDLAAGLVGSLGLCGSAQVGDGVAVFEPVHGSAPDIAGKGVANPIGEIEAAALMMEYLGGLRGDEALLNASTTLRDVVRGVVEEGRVLTPDIGGSAGTEEVGREVRERLARRLGLRGT